MALGFIFSAGTPATALENASVNATVVITSAAAPDTIQPPPKITVAAETARTPEYFKEMLQTMKYLSAILARQNLFETKKLEGTSQEIAKLNERLEALLGPKILKELEAEETALLWKEREAAAKSSLAETRTALQSYYADYNGAFPKNLSKLLSGYLKAIPELELPGHGKTGKVTIIDSTKYDYDLASAVTDSGGWLYFTNQDSVNSGMLAIDCSHKNPAENLEWYKY